MLDLVVFRTVHLFVRGVVQREALFHLTRVARQVLLGKALSVAEGKGGSLTLEFLGLEKALTAGEEYPSFHEPPCRKSGVSFHTCACQLALV